MKSRMGVSGGMLLALLVGTSALAAPAQKPSENWVGAWASAQFADDAVKAEDLTDSTLRQIVRLSVGGDRIRVRLSNAFGTAPLHLSAVHVARAIGPGSPRIVLGTDTALTFAGATEVTIPAGADYLSDPIDLAVPALSDLAVSLRFDQPPARQTLHVASHATSWILGGDHLAAPDLPDARRVEHWYQVSGVEVVHASGATIVALGDSITDGSGSTTDRNERWPDRLAARLRAEPRTAGLGVVNVGIGGNRLVLDGRGPNALARFDRDVLTQAGVKYLVVLEGINDLGTLTREQPASEEAHAERVAEIIAAYGQIIERAHQRGIRVYGGTILPFGRALNYHPDAANERDRQAVNAWIRTPGHFDGVIDFDQRVRDPEHPDQLVAAYDSGDHLHPSPAGYAAMAEAIDLKLFLPR